MAVEKSSTTAYLNIVAEIATCRHACCLPNGVDALCKHFPVSREGNTLKVDIER